MAHTADPIDFQALDALLEQAYALEGQERTTFVESLPEDQREQLRRLLEVSTALSVGSIAANAEAIFRHLKPSSPGATASDASAAVAGHWRLHKELGGGGMGQVFYATREGPDRLLAGGSDYVQEAAVKVLWSLRADEDVRARFIRERRILASLSHPGLARFIDGGFLTDGRPWFAMEFVKGGNIGAHARSLSTEACLRLFQEVCVTVSYAHQRLIVHRDIKPANVLVDGAGRARLLDFGIAGVLEDIDDGVQTRTVGGPLTLQYASPEQVSGGVVAVASDIYQLGLLLYEMLTGVPPYDVKDLPLSDAVNRICRRRPPKPSTLNPAVGADLDAIVMTALAKDPDERYRAASTLAEDVDAYLDGRPIRALPPNPWYLTQRFLRRNLLMTTIVVVISALGLAVATVVSIRMAREATAQAVRSATAQNILSDVFRKADPFKGRGAPVTLAEALVRAQPEIAARVARDPLLAWEVNYTLAKIYESIGLVEEERGAYAAMVNAARLLGEDGRGRRFLTGVAGVGNVLARTNPVEAVQYFGRLLPAQPSSEDEMRPWLSAQYSFVGALFRVRRFDRARIESMAMARAVDTFGVTKPRARGQLSLLLAEVARHAGDIDAEARHWTDTIKFMRQANRPSALAIALSNWGVYLTRTERFGAAEAAFSEAMAILEDAGLKDASYANVLRGYAGLLFRMGRIDDAIATTTDALSLLPAEAQPYARFVAELSLAQFTFLKGDAHAALDVMIRALLTARSRFSGDATVARRMSRLFAKVLVFAREPGLARVALGLSGEGCHDEGQVMRALDGLERLSEQTQRRTLWKALDAIEARDRTGELQQADLTLFLSGYQQDEPMFFDALDQWRVLDRLASLSRRVSLGPTLTRRYETLHAARGALSARVNSMGAETLYGLVDYLNGAAVGPPSCR